MKNQYEEKWRGLWTLEYNQGQKKFHIQEADTRFQINAENFIQDLGESWSILGVFNSYEECERYKEEIETNKKLVKILEKKLEMDAVKR